MTKTPVIAYNAKSGKPVSVYASIAAMRKEGMYAWSIEQVLDGRRLTHNKMTFRHVAAKDISKLGKVKTKISAKKAKSLGINL